MNSGLVQPDGAKLTSASLIRPGWVLHMPRDARGPGIEVVTVPVHPGDEPAVPPGTGSPDAPPTGAGQPARQPRRPGTRRTHGPRHPARRGTASDGRGGRAPA